MTGTFCIPFHEGTGRVAAPCVGQRPLRPGRGLHTPGRISISYPPAFLARAAQTLDRLSIPEPNSGCTLWFGAQDRFGHGRIQTPGRRMDGTHRVAWMVAHGPIPAGMYVCHKCDVPACVNPDHLFVGTASDNMRDMVSKGRGIMRPVEGSKYGRHPRAKLTAEQVLAIRKATGTHAAIALNFATNAENISRIRRGLTWKELL